MNTLILHPTETCHWHALVSEAQITSSLVLDEGTESYLVFLLMRYTQNQQLLESILALDFLESLQSARPKQIDLLKGIGDKSLLFSGLFPGLAKKRRVNLNYFSGLGQAAYLTLSELEESQLSDLFFQLSSKFLVLQKVLQAMRNQYLRMSNLDSNLMLLSSTLYQ